MKYKIKLYIIFKIIKQTYLKKVPFLSATSGSAIEYNTGLTAFTVLRSPIKKLTILRTHLLKKNVWKGIWEVNAEVVLPGSHVITETFVP